MTNILSARASAVNVNGNGSWAKIMMENSEWNFKIFTLLVFH